MLESMFYEKRLALPVIADTDVLVIGGGPGGLGAAVAAARQGARVTLVERYGVLGGMASMGEVHPFMPNHVSGECLDRPVYADWAARIHTYFPEGDSRREVTAELHSGEDRKLSKDVAALAAEDLCLEAGVRILYHHTAVDVVHDARRLYGVVLVSKSGFQAARGLVVVDATGDADIAALSGCPCDIGGPSGHCQPMTLCFKLSHVDQSLCPPRDEVNRLYDEARERGEIDCPRENVLSFSWLDDDVVHFNTTRVTGRRGTDGVELSEAECEGHRQLRELLAFLRTHVSGYAQAQLHSMGHHIGVRETRRIRGQFVLTREHFRARATFEDAVARVHYPIDIHSPDGSGTEHERLEPHEWYEIPYRALIPQGVHNLLVAGRPISVDHAVHSSMRVMPPACSVGQAAGTAAAMSLQTGIDPALMDGRAVRRALLEFGASL